VERCWFVEDDPNHLLAIVSSAPTTVLMGLKNCLDREAGILGTNLDVRDLLEIEPSASPGRSLPETQIDYSLSHTFYLLSFHCRTHSIRLGEDV
jgi:hypothetical protein